MSWFAECDLRGRHYRVDFFDNGQIAINGLLIPKATLRRSSWRHRAALCHLVLVMPDLVWRTAKFDWRSYKILRETLLDED